MGKFYKYKEQKCAGKQAFKIRFNLEIAVSQSQSYWKLHFGGKMKDCNSTVELLLVVAVVLVAVVLVVVIY